MTPRSYSSKAIVLSKKNYSEADRIIGLYSQKYGKLSLLAKGVRKTKSKKRGHLEVFSNITFSATRTKGMDLLVEVATLNDYKQIRNSLKKVSLAYYFCEVISKIVREGERNDEVYKLLLASFETLEKTSSLKKFRLYFVYNLLVILGYWPKGKKLIDVDTALEEVLERSINSVRVGKRVLV